MKKRAVLSILVAAMLVGVALSGCGSKASDNKEEAAASESAAEEATSESQAEPEAESQTEESTSESGEAAQGSAGIANPWSEVESAEEAAEIADVGSFEIAEDLGVDLGEEFDRSYRAMAGVAEVRLEFPASALTIRKGRAAAEGDISGDFNVYKSEWTQDVDGIEVSCAGNRDGDSIKSIWSADDMYYSICAEGLGGDEDFGLNADALAAAVQGIK